MTIAQRADRLPGGIAPDFLTRLMQYKDFIAILIFLSGGVAWIDGVFATKHQVAVLQCLTNQNLSQIRSTNQIKSLSDQIVDNKMELQALERTPNPSPEDAEKAARLDQQIQLDMERLKQSQLNKDEAFRSLNENRCSNGARGVTQGAGRALRSP